MARNNQQVQPAINKMAARFGYSPQEMLGIAKIESSLNPNSRTGSYKGLFQLSNEEFKRFGPKGGNIFNAEHNAMAAGALFNANDKTFQRKTGMEPNGQDRYLMHQQGVAGYMAHLKNPDRPAAENFAKASKWSAAKAEKAIWGNMTPEMRAQFPGGVKTVKSGDFLGHYENRTAQFGIGPGQSGSPIGPAETARHIAAQKARDEVFENAPGGVGEVAPRVLASGSTKVTRGLDDLPSYLDTRTDTLGGFAERRIAAEKGEKAVADILRDIAREANSAGTDPRLTSPNGGIRTRGVPVQATAPETGAGRFAAPGLAGATVPQSPSTMEGFMPPSVPNTTAGLIPGISEPSLPEPTAQAAQAPLDALSTAPWKPPTWEEAQGAAKAPQGLQSLPQGLQEVPEGSQGPVQAASPQGGPKAPVFSSSPPARSTAPQTQFDGWPDWAIKAFQMEPTGTAGGVPGGMPGAIPSTTNWMSQFPTFGSLFQSSPGGGFGGFAPVNLGGP